MAEMNKNLVITALMLIMSCLCLAHPPYGIVMDHAGNLYFADIIHHGRGTLWKLDKNKKLTPLLKDFHAHNVNIDQAGNIYSAHGEETHTLIRINPAGDIDTLIMETDENQYFGGNAVVSNSGRIYFGINRKIWEWDNEKVDSINHEDLKWNQGFYVDQDETIYATDIGRGQGGSLIKIMRDGSSKVIADQLIDVGDGEFDPYSEVLLGVKKDDSGNVYVCDLGGKRVARIDDDNKVESYYESDEGWMPCGITFKDDKSYVIEFQDGMERFRIVMNQGETKEVYYDFQDYSSQNRVDHVIPSGRTKWIIYCLVGVLFVFTILMKKSKKARSVGLIFQ